ncbi:MAG: glycosyltransferase family 4 protein, partial [Flavobacteriaceae bacterium]|nr:glycosyltransferase family 4 protein [Flavobacteriaceae bacterium]
RLASLLSTAGYKTIVLTIDMSATSEEDDSIVIETNGIILIRLKKTFHQYYNYYKKYFKQGNINAPYWIAIGMAMQDWIAANQLTYKIDIIEASAYGGIGSFFKVKDFPPVILSGHGAFFQYKRINKNKPTEQTELIEKLEHFAFKNVDGIISHSPQSKEDIEQFTKVPVFLARIAFLPEYNALIKETHETASSNKYALVVGSLQELKGPFTLFEAISHLNIPEENFKVIWVGSDNYYQPTGQRMSIVLENKYPELWNKKIVWEQNTDDKKLAAFYQNAAFIIIPTLWESFNVISIEASFFKKPIIITSTTGSSFLFQNEENAIIIEPGDRQSLANAILLLYNSTELCTKLGIAAYNSISKQLEPARIVDDRISIYTNIIKNKTNNVIVFDPSILKKYITPSRKIYFACRQFIKNIIKK